YIFALTAKYDRTPDTAKFGQNTSTADFTVAYTFLDDRLNVNLDANLHINHDGIDFSKFATYAPTVQLYHDAVLREQVLLVGPGVGYQITDTLDLNVTARFFAWGINTINASVYGVSLRWSAL